MKGIIKRHPKWTVAILLSLILVIGFGIAWFAFSGLRIRVNTALENVGVLPPSLPLYLSPNASPDRLTLRLLVADAVRDARAQEDYPQMAALNALLSQEAFMSAYRTLNAWETMRDPNTGLIPLAASPWFRQWEADAVAGNLFSHLFIASRYLDPDSFGLWQQTFESERTICGAMPCSIEIDSSQVMAQDQLTRTIGASEYIRDGLLSISERFGRGPWFDRMEEAVNVMLDAADTQTTSGNLFTNSAEINGAQLQVLTRLYWATRNEAYLEMAERIAEVYLFEVMPQSNGLLTNFWDFQNNHPLPEDVRVRPASESIPGVYPVNLVDHGAEMISGLAELYLLERSLDRPQADRFREPIQVFLDKILTIGRTPEGLWYRSVVLDTLEPFVPLPNDTWGYNLAGLQTFDLANGTERYSDEIENMMRAVSNTFSLEWEYGPQADGYADSIESMLYLLPWHDIPEAHYWVDHEIEVMFLKQREDGFVEGWFLDGNYVRTALLYGQYKTQGLMLDPWSDVVRVGAAFDEDQDVLHIYLAASEEWEGRLTFDSPRHQTIWGMPIEYPRVNAMPEWYTVEPDEMYQVANMGEDGAITTYSGQELIDGLPFSLSEAESIELTVSKA
jgi:hypothetical protein